jgi:Cysteine-rich CWC
VNTGEPKAPLAGDSSEQKTCPVCGAPFGCMAAQGSCWCAGVKLTDKATADLRARFSDCLCPRCLALAAEREIRQPGEKNSTEKPAI